MGIISIKKYIGEEENKAREREAKIMPLINILNENLPILATIPGATDGRSEAQTKAYWLALQAKVDLLSLGLRRFEITERLKPGLKEVLEKWFH